MDWGFLFFLAEPWFVIPWYLIGITGFFYVAFDVSRYNTPLKQAMKWAWPVIVLFFSVIGLALYFGTARAPGISRLQDEESRQKVHKEYEKNMFRRVNGAVIHCVAGDGLGIMTAMVIARAAGMSFWQEFWFEYLVGFLFGWFIFQYRSMSMMTDSKVAALWMAFRAEFMSMLTVMAGMGVVMGYLTPLAVTEQPKPLTWAFWGFGMFGLLLGYIFTWPMNWIMVKLGWKHGMGGMESGHQVQRKGPRYAVLAGMWTLGALALAFPAWLAEVRQGTPVRPDAAGVPSLLMRGSAGLGFGLRESLQAAQQYLGQDQRSSGAHAIDAAHRAATVAEQAVAGSGFGNVRREIERVRHELHMGREPAARRALASALDQVANVSIRDIPRPVGLYGYGGATVINAHGVIVGEVDAVSDGRLLLSLGGFRDVWGFVDLTSGERMEIPVDSLALGPAPAIGLSLVSVLTREAIAATD